MYRYANAVKLIGKTPLVKIKETATDNARIWAKLEMFNPGRSVKDRIALAMVEAAEQGGMLKPGGTIVEATSGNTGIGLALVAAVKGYNLVLVMPETMSAERKILLRAYGADLYLTPGEQGMSGSLSFAQQLLRENKDWFMPDQFNNPANPEYHFQKTAVELWQQTGGKIDAFVAGVGTGGTITGVGRYLKSKNPDIKIIAVEPKRSPVLSGGQPGPHKIQGIGAGFIPPLLEWRLIDEIITVDDKEAFSEAQNLAINQGIYAGISSGAALWAARQAAKSLKPLQNIVTLLPDVGERYLSMTPYFRLDFR